MSGRKIHLPKNLKARPTTDFARESLFNILSNKIDYTESKILDLFAGTGAISFEFASLGSEDITSIEQNFIHASFIQNNCAQMNIKTIKVYRSDVFKFVQNCQSRFDVIFADPPFDHARFSTIPALIKESGILAENGIFILEHGPSRDFTDIPGHEQTRKYGKVHFSFFRF